MNWSAKLCCRFSGFADAGFWIAAINRRDDFHQPAKRKLAELSKQNDMLITTCAVIAETSHLLLTRLAGFAVYVVPCNTGKEKTAFDLYRRNRSVS